MLTPSGYTHYNERTSFYALNRMAVLTPISSIFAFRHTDYR